MSGIQGSYCRERLPCSNQENPAKEVQIKQLKMVHILELSKPYPYLSTLEKRELYQTSSTIQNQHP